LKVSSFAEYHQGIERRISVTEKQVAARDLLVFALLEGSWPSSGYVPVGTRVCTKPIPLDRVQVDRRQSSGGAILF
jgi:hypothetical protein